MVQHRQPLQSTIFTSWPVCPVCLPNMTCSDQALSNNCQTVVDLIALLSPEHVSIRHSASIEQPLHVIPWSSRVYHGR